MRYDNRMYIFDTLSGEKKELRQPRRFGIFPRPLNLFVCGPTVYDYPHIGNARTFVFFDMFVKYLRSQGFKIFYLQNITNVDDKIIQRAIDEKTTWDAIAQRYEDVFMEYNRRLGITSVDTFARSTEFIPQVIAQVKTLIKKGYAYKIDGDGWYFDLKTFPGYGKLSRRTMEQAETSAEQGTSRVDNSNNKRNAGDFCLWKFTKTKDEPSWSFETGEYLGTGAGLPAEALAKAGRPGWHIEDTATTEDFFGPQYDMHGGALDLKFPHHEAELTQQEAASGKSPFVNFWMHAGFLTVNGTKMSKSLGNFLTVDDVLKKMTADEFRMMLFMHHYRQPLDFSEQTVKMAKDTLHYFRVKMNIQTPHTDNDIENEYRESLNDDFNTPRAIAALRRSEDPSFIEKALAGVGITLRVKIPQRVQELMKQRELSRASKQFAQSDALRAEIEQLGYVVEDTPAGPLVLPAENSKSEIRN